MKLSVHIAEQYKLDYYLIMEITQKLMVLIGLDVSSLNLINAHIVFPQEKERAYYVIKDALKNIV